jgi:hypothetical protein
MVVQYLSPVKSVDAKQSIVIDAKEQESLVTLCHAVDDGSKRESTPSGWG